MAITITITIWKHCGGRERGVSWVFIGVDYILAHHALLRAQPSRELRNWTTSFIARIHIILIDIAFVIISISIVLNVAWSWSNAFSNVLKSCSAEPTYILSKSVPTQRSQCQPRLMLFNILVWNKSCSSLVEFNILFCWYVVWRDLVQGGRLRDPSGSDGLPLLGR